MVQLTDVHAIDTRQALLPIKEGPGEEAITVVIYYKILVTYL